MSRRGSMGSGPRGPRGFLTEEEKAQQPQISWALVRRILSYLKPYRWHLLAVFAVLLLASVIGLLPSLITGRIIDTALADKNMSLLFKLVLASFATVILSQVIGVLESHINASISSGIIYDMRNQMFAHLQTMEHDFYTSENQGDIITRMNSDISGVSSVISGTLTNFVSNVLTLFTTLFALFSLSWKLALVGIMVIPLLVLPTQSAGKSRYYLATEGQTKRDRLNGIINESLSVSGSLLIKLFHREESKNKEFEAINKDVTDFSVKESRAGQWFRVAMGIFTNIGPMLIYLAGGYLLISGKDPNLSVGAITTTISMINRLYRPVQSLLGVHVDFIRSCALFDRIFAYLDRKSVIVNPENPVKPDLEKTDIEYSHVEFGYRENQTILKDISFRIDTGRTYAIVGKSGSGKSTIANLLPRLYDVRSGSVSINDVDVRDFDLGYLRENIGVVTQEAYLFNGTIRDNLLFAKPEATEMELIAACKIANIYDFVQSQPKGFDTEVGNRGLKLSGGEKQRLSIARVILKDPKILILDEATSSLDSISESLIQEALERLMINRTSIVIAHRLSTILAADRILAIEDGVIKEQGSHEELLEKNGLYRELYETQFRKVIDMELDAA